MRRKQQKTNRRNIEYIRKKKKKKETITNTSTHLFSQVLHAPLPEQTRSSSTSLSHNNGMLLSHFFVSFYSHLPLLSSLPSLFFCYLLLSSPPFSFPLFSPLFFIILYIYIFFHIFYIFTLVSRRIYATASLIKYVPSRGERREERGERREERGERREERGEREDEEEGREGDGDIVPFLILS